MSFKNKILRAFFSILWGKNLSLLQREKKCIVYDICKYGTCIFFKLSFYLWLNNSVGKVIEPLDKSSASFSYIWPFKAIPDLQKPPEIFFLENVSPVSFPVNICAVRI